MKPPRKRRPRAPRSPRRCRCAAGRWRQRAGAVVAAGQRAALKELKQSTRSLAAGLEIAPESALSGKDLELLLRRIIREEAGVTPVVPAAKWRGGEMVLRGYRGSLYRDRTAALGARDDAWFNIEIVSPWRSAGVQRFIAAAEIASEEYFNPVVPEDIAALLRGVG